MEKTPGQSVGSSVCKLKALSGVGRTVESLLALQSECEEEVKGGAPQC